MRQRILSFIASFALVFTLAQTPLMALAQNSGQGMEKRIEKTIDKISQKIDDEEVTGERQSVSIKPNGNFFLTGVVVEGVSVANQTLTGRIYNASHTASVAGTRIIGAGKQVSLGDIKVGDKITVRGNYNVTTRITTISEIHNISQRSTLLADLQRQLNELLKRLQEIMGR